MHGAAFGTKFKIENLEKINQFGNSLDLNTETEYNVIKSYSANTEIPSELFYIGEGHKDIWGNGIEYPIFGIENIKLNGQDIFELGRNKTTIKFEYKGYEFIKHFVSRVIREEEMFVGEDKDMIWTVVGKLMINEWEGNIKKQVVIQEFEVKEDTGLDNSEIDWRDAF